MTREIIRKCCVCATLKNRNNFIKITKLSDDVLKINPSEKDLGRSAYVCKSKECIKDLIKKKRLKNALKISNQNEIERVEKLLLEADLD